MIKLRSDILNGLILSFPIFLGYIPIGITIGILAKNFSFSFFYTVLWTIVLHAGSSQTVAMNLINLGSNIFYILIITVLINFRYVFMSSAVVNKLKSEKTHLFPFIAFAVNDETFSLICSQKGKISSVFALTVNFFTYTGFVIGVALGHKVGNILPEIISQAFNFLIYALFIGILVPNVAKNYNKLIILFISGATNWILLTFLNLNPALSILVSMIFALLCSFKV